MFSPELYSSEGFVECAPETLVEGVWKEFCEKHRFPAALLIEVDIAAESLKVVSGYGIPVQPFNGLERSHLLALLNDCFDRYSKPHVHSLHTLVIGTILPRLSHKIGPVNRVLFAPVRANETNYILLAFPSASEKGNIDVPSVLAHSAKILCVVSVLRTRAETAERLSVSELFVKEIGHDIASSVQAIIAKVRTIRDGRISDADGIKRKAREIEQETNSAFGIADMLGLAIDPNYGLRSYVDFDASKILKNAVEQLSAEAQERHIKIDVLANADGIKLWGDERAIHQCLVQVLLNAIKYSHGGTVIKASVVNRSDTVSYHFNNVGLELPKGEELKLIWDFGFRSAKAKELHVNGSGVGLYTVRKIVRAHRGRAWADGSGGNTTFSIEIPKRDKLKKELGFLV